MPYREIVSIILLIRACTWIFEMQFVFSAYNSAFYVNKHIHRVGFSVGFDYGVPARRFGGFKQYYAVFVGRNTELYSLSSYYISFHV
jgi:hypothetical protein